MSDKNLNLTAKEGKDLPKPASNSEAPVAPAVINPLESVPEYFELMGTDSTSPLDISSIEIIDEQESVKTWMGKGKKPKKGQVVNNDEVIKEGIELIEEISGEANRVINIAFKNFADKAIQIGLICHKLKVLIRGNKQPWAVWAEENLPFIAKRNREKYMRLASRQDFWPFSFLGVDRGELLCSVTEDMDGDDRIGNLLKKYKIPFNEEMEINMSEFKAMIDAAINNERLTNNGLTINFNLITNIVNLGVDFDKSMIKRLKDIQECGGNPENLLQKLMLTGGQENVDTSPDKRLKDFNHLSNRLIVTLEFIMQDEAQLAKIHKDTFEKLMAKLNSIQELGILNEDEKKVA